MEQASTINVDIDKTNTEIKLSDISKGAIEFIPLEISEQIIIDEIDIFKVTPDKLFLFSDANKALYCFSAEGKYLYSIDKIGNGPGEIADFVNFLINPFNNTVEVMDVGNGKILVYTENGGLMMEKKYEFEGHYFEVLDSNTYAVFANTLPNGENPSNLFYINTEYSVTKKFLPIDERFTHFPLTYPVRFTVNEKNKFLLTETFSNKVYELDKQGPRVKYLINFGKYIVTEESKEILYTGNDDFQRMKSQKKFLEVLNKKYCWNINNFFESANYLGFHFSYNMSIMHFLQNKHTNQSLILEQKYMLDNNIALPGVTLLMQNDTIYAYLTADNLIEYNKELKAKYTSPEIDEQNMQHAYLKALYEFASQNPSGTPLLLKIKLNF